MRIPKATPPAQTAGGFSRGILQTHAQTTGRGVTCLHFRVVVPQKQKPSTRKLGTLQRNSCTWVFLHSLHHAKTQKCSLAVFNAKMHRCLKPRDVLEGGGGG